MRGILLPLLDVLVILLSALVVAAILSILVGVEARFYFGAAYRELLFTSCFLSPWVMHRFGLYGTSGSGYFVSESIKVLSAWVTVALLLSALAFLTKSNISVSRVWAGSWFLVSLCGFIFFRVGLIFVENKVGRYARSKPIVIIGSGELTRHVLKRLDQIGADRYPVLGCFLVDQDQGVGLIDIPCLGSADSVEQYFENIEPQSVELWIALSSRKAHLLDDYTNLINQPAIDIRIIPDFLNYALLSYELEDIFGLPVVNLNKVYNDPISRSVKWLEDKLIATFILVLITPLLLAISIAIKYSSRGPVIFRQLRHGWNGEIITIYKFRTMRMHEEPTGTLTLAGENDPRITAVGRFLRRTSLDELPQFINVLQGRISIVGPRVQAVVINDQYSSLVSGYMLRHKVKPGITGWAQINGLRGDMSRLDAVRSRIEHDLYYIKNWSIWLDLAIILMTVFKGFNSPNAR